MCRTATIATLVSIILMSLAACSPPSGTAPSGPATSPTTGPAGALQKVTLVIATQDLNIGYPFATFPLAMGWFKDEGLDVTVVPGQSSAATIQLLISGKGDLGVLVPDSLILGVVNQSTPLKIVYAITRKNDYSFAVMANSPIKDVKDLKGKKIGHADLGAGTIPYSRAREKEAGMAITDVQEIAVGYGSQAMDALQKGTVDTYLSFAGGWARLKHAGYDFRLLPDAPWQNNLYGFSMAATDDYIAQHPDIIAKVGRAMSKATVFLRTNPEAGVYTFWKQYPDRAPKDRGDKEAFATDLDILKAQLTSMRAFDLPVDFKWGSQTADVWKFQQQFLFDSGQIKNQVEPTKFFYNAVQDDFTKFDFQAIAKQAQDWKP